MVRRRNTRRLAAPLATTAVLLVAVACTVPPDPEIEVTELDGPLAPLDVTVTGLPPASDVRVESGAAVDGYDFSAEATFTVPDDGVLRLAESAPDAGDRASADAMASFWALTAPGDSGLANWEAPHSVDLAVHDETGDLLASTTVERPGTALGVEARSVTEDGLVAEYAVPADLGSGTRPAVLASGGSEGGLHGGAYVARHLASLGYPALGISYFGRPGQPADLEEVPVETFLTALDWLHEQPEVATDRVVTFGASRGGEMGCGSRPSGASACTGRSRRPVLVTCSALWRTRRPPPGAWVVNRWLTPARALRRSPTFVQPRWRPMRLRAR